MSKSEQEKVAQCGSSEIALEIKRLEEGPEYVAHYDYRCKRCNKNFEVEQKISEEPLKACPKCGDEEGFCKLISIGTSFSLKGRGWFKDGY